MNFLKLFLTVGRRERREKEGEKINIKKSESNIQIGERSGN